MSCPSWKINYASRIKVNFLNFNTLCSRLLRHSNQWKNTVLSLLAWNDTVLGCSYVTVHCTVILQCKNLGYIYENPSYNKNTVFRLLVPSVPWHQQDKKLAVTTPNKLLRKECEVSLWSHLKFFRLICTICRVCRITSSTITR